MLGELSAALSDLNEDDRLLLANLLDKRNDYFEQQITLNKLRINALLHPSPANDEAVSDFSSAVIAPLRDGITKDAMALLTSAVNMEGLTRLLPIVVSGLLQSVNLTLLFTTFGLEPDTVEQIIGKIAAYIKSGL